MEKAGLIAGNYPFVPTAAQQVFCDRIAIFLCRKEENRCFVLHGYAGTGKTTSVAALVRSLPQFRMKAVLLAPTGRAAKVMSSYTGKNALTIHKKIYQQRAAISFEPSFQLAPNLHRDTLFIVDEASMLDDEWNMQNASSFLNDLIRYVYQPTNDGKYKNCCLLFVGDTAQLPPVGSAESPALNNNYLSGRFNLDVDMVELTEVVRQQQKSGILANATQLRKMIAGERKAKTAFPRFRSKGYPDMFRMTGHRLVEGLEYAYHKFGITNSLIVCRSNKSANSYNNQIRARLLYREEGLTGGDQVMVVRNNYFWLPENEYTAFIANGDMAQVVRVRREEERYGFRFAEVILEFLDYPELGSVTCKVILDTLQAETPNLSAAQHKQLYEQLLLDYAHLPTRKEQIAALKADPYYNALQLKFAYAVTCHKAQGGQWDVVFVDQGYLTDDMMDTEFLRWLYTAMTRAKKELFMVNFADRFFPEENIAGQDF